MIRDYLCSKTTKSNYLFHPIDLVMLSGTLAEHHEIAVLDAVAERLDAPAARTRIERFDPQAIVSLVGSVSWPTDRAFLADQAARGRRVLALGDVLHEDAPTRLVEEPWLEAALHHFAGDDVLHVLDETPLRVRDATVRCGDAIVVRRRDPRRLPAEYRVPRPRHELFPRRGYRFSFARGRRFATVLTDWGCPYPCTFCVIGTLGFQTRPLEDVLVELDHLRADGVREVFFVDQTFGVRRKRALELCAALERRGDLGWTAFTRPDRADPELLRAMRRGGCHTLILGIESADDALLAAYRKGYTSADARRAVALARAVGLRTVGTFIIGLPEQDGQALARTLDLALDLDLDFFSLNVAVPRFGTPFRARALDEGLARRDELVMDQGGASACLPTHVLDRGALLALKKRMVRRFYLRPRYLLRRLAAVSGPRELAAQVREGLALLGRNL